MADTGEKQEEPKKDESDKHKPVELNLFDLLLRDLTIDFEIIKTYRGNLTALKSYLGGIGNMRVRETFNMFIQDSEQVMAQQYSQRAIMISAITKAHKQWKGLQQQHEPKPDAKETPSSPPTTSVEDATEPKLTSADEKTSSAPDAGEQEKSPHPQA